MPERAYVLQPCLGLFMHWLWHRTRDVGHLVDPAALLFHRRIHIPQCCPKAQSTIPTGQIRRNRQSTFLQAAKKVSPAVCILAEPVHDAKNILVSVFVRPNNHLHTLTIIVQTRVEVDTVRPDVHVTLSRQVSLAPRFIFVPPARLQPRDRRRRQSICIRSYKRSQCLAEVSRRNTFEVKPRQKLFHGFGLAQIRRH